MIMEKLTFEQLPEAVALLLEKVNHIEQLLCSGKVNENHFNPMLSVSEAASYLGISLSLMYKLTYRRALPVYKPSGGKVYLKREDLLAYMTKNRLMSQDEIEQEAINYVVKNPIKNFR